MDIYRRGVSGILDKIDGGVELSCSMAKRISGNKKENVSELSNSGFLFFVGAFCPKVAKELILDMARYAGFISDNDVGDEAYIKLDMYLMRHKSYLECKAIKDMEDVDLVFLLKEMNRICYSIDYYQSRKTTQSLFKELNLTVQK